MVKNDSVSSVISVISVWQVGIWWIQPKEYSNTISLLYNRRYVRCTDSVNVICSDDKNDSIISVISVISVRQVGIGRIQPREYSNTIS